jgi:hypothetical protein
MVITPMHSEESGTGCDLEKSQIYVTSDSTFWAAMRSKEIYPFKFQLTENSVEVSYALDTVSSFIHDVSKGVVKIDELTAHGTTVMWKAIIGFMKMLSRYDNDLKFAPTGPGEKERIHAFTTDQYLVWVLTYRGITPTQVSSRGKDTIFEYSQEKITQIKDFLFSSYIGSSKDLTYTRNVWRQAKTIQRIVQ